MQSNKYFQKILFTALLIPAASCGSALRLANSDAPSNAVVSQSSNGADDANSLPAYTGVFFQDSNQLYLSAQPITCDSNALQPNQTILRLDFSSDKQGGDYNIVTDFYTNPGKDTVPVAMKLLMGFDASCQSLTNPNDNGSLSAFDAVNLQVVDPKSGAPSGQLTIGPSPQGVARFTSVACPVGSINPYVPTWNTHCALYGCDPIALTCEAPVVQATADTNNLPVYTGVFFQDSNQLYLSSQPISCDSNALQPNQTILRLDFSSDKQGSDYNIVTDFYTNPGKDTVPVAMKMLMGFDASCQSLGNTNDVGALSTFDAVNLQVVDPKSGAPSGQLTAGPSPQSVARFTSVACPAGSVDPYVPTWNTHCALYGCDPIALTCAAPH